MTIELRRAHPSDAEFLAQMVAAAATWRPGSPLMTAVQVLEDPALAHYVHGWPRPGDLGIIAEDRRPVGAAWLRLLPGSDPGFGFIDASTPELSIAVVATHRGHGIGTSLLAALIDAAQSAGHAKLSLSVETDNYALSLYERFGFRRVSTGDGATTMLRRLDM